MRQEMPVGGAKRAMDEAYFNGWWPIDGDVCANCIFDDDLLRLHAAHCHESEDGCAFCGTQGVPIAPAKVIQEHIMSCLRQDYETVDEAGIPYNGREGGWLAKTWSGWELVQQDVMGIVGDKLLEQMADAAAESQWARADWALLNPLERLKDGWSGFRSTVRHHLRFSFFFEPESDEGHPDSTSSLSTLMGIGYFVDVYGLVKVIPAGTELFRVRIDVRDRYSGINDLGAPPHQFAKANRMSPAGISMFYGALDYDTAVKETMDGDRAAICSKGTFRTTRDLTVVDFTGLPPVPGYWSNPGRDHLASICFMHELVNEFSEPVDRNTSVDLHYTPTQVVAEYLLKARHLRPSSHGGESPDPILGIQFASSHTGVANLALNLYHAEDKVLGGNRQDEWLELIKVEHLALMP